MTEEPAQLVAGDRLQLTVFNRTARDQKLTVDVGTVAEPVLPPPASVYGLATLRPTGNAVATALFATAPLPQKIEFPDLSGDLVAGHVRRRGLFLWPFATPYAPDSGQPFASLVKVDRTGGRQLPDNKSDFLSYDK